MSSAQDLAPLAAQVVPFDNLPFNIPEQKWSELSTRKQYFLMKLHKAVDKIQKTKRSNITYNYISSFRTLNFYFTYKHNNQIYKYLKEVLMTYGHVQEYHHTGTGKYHVYINVS